MADNGFTTPPPGAELDARPSDRVALQTVNTLLEAALRADWALFESRLSMDSDEGCELAHEAACAWSSCDDALAELRGMSGIDARIDLAASYFADEMPPALPDRTRISIRSAELFECSRAARKEDVDLGAIIETSACLLHAYGANLALMSLRPAA